MQLITLFCLFANLCFIIPSLVEHKYDERGLMSAYEELLADSESSNSYIAFDNYVSNYYAQTPIECLSLVDKNFKNTNFINNYLLNALYRAFRNHSTTKLIQTFNDLENSTKLVSI